MGIETLAVASIGASLLGAGISAYGSIQEGKATQTADNYRAAVSDNMAQYTLYQGERMAQDQNMRTSAIIAKQHAQQGASGIDVNSGSPVAVRQSAAELGKLDALTIMNNAANKAAGLRNEGVLDTMSGANAKTASYLKAGSSILGGATSVSDKWLTYDTKGVFGGSTGATAGYGFGAG